MILMMLTLCVVAMAWTDTAVGRALRDVLVDRPARKLAAVARGKAVFYAGLGLAGLIAVILFGAEGLQLFGFMAPETMAWFVMFDVGVFIDALILASLLASSRGWQSAKMATQQWRERLDLAFGRIRTAMRATRTPRPRRPARRPDDSEPRPGRAHPRPYFAFSMA